MNLEERAAMFMFREIRIVGIGGRATINDHGRLCYSDLDPIWSSDTSVDVRAWLSRIHGSIIIGTVGLDREGPIPQPHALAVCFI